MCIRDSKYGAFNIVIKTSQYVKYDESLEAFSFLHMAMYGFAFESSKDRARIYFDKASKLRKDSPQVKRLLLKKYLEIFFVNFLILQSLFSNMILFIRSCVMNG